MQDPKAYFATVQSTVSAYKTALKVRRLLCQGAVSNEALLFHIHDVNVRHHTHFPVAHIFVTSTHSGCCFKPGCSAVMLLTAGYKLTSSVNPERDRAIGLRQMWTFEAVFVLETTVRRRF